MNRVNRQFRVLPRMFSAPGGSMLTSAAQSYDVDIIYCSPVMGIADAGILPNAAAATMMAGQSGKIRSVTAQVAVNRSHAARAKILVTGVTQFDVAVGGYGDHYAQGVY